MLRTAVQVCNPTSSICMSGINSEWNSTCNYGAIELNRSSPWPNIYSDYSLRLWGKSMKFWNVVMAWSYNSWFPTVSVFVETDRCHYMARALDRQTDKQCQWSLSFIRPLYMWCNWKSETILGLFVSKKKRKSLKLKMPSAFWHLKESENLNNVSGLWNYEVRCGEKQHSNVRTMEVRVVPWIFPQVNKHHALQL